MPEPVEPEHLVVGEVEGALHAADAPVQRVLITAILAAATVAGGRGPVGPAVANLAAGEVRDERPAVVAVPRVVLLHGLLELADELRPDAVEVVLVLEVHPVHPPLLLGDEQVDERGLVVGFSLRPPCQRRGEQPPGVVAGAAPGRHDGPGVEQVQRPLAVPEQEAGGAGGVP